LYEKGFEIEIFNKYFTVVNSLPTNNVVQLNDSKKIIESASYIQTMQINNFTNTVSKPPVRTRQQPDVTLFEFIRSRVCIKSRYKPIHYDLFINLVKDNFEIMNLFKSYFVNKYIQKTLLNEEQRKEVMVYKENIYIHMDEVNVLPLHDLDKSFNLERHHI
jgi:hypothetical protein